MGLVLHHHGDNDINGWQNKAYATYECYKVEKKTKEAKGEKKLWSPSPSECEPADTDKGSIKLNMTLFNLLISETPEAICQETSPVATRSVM